MGRKKVGSKIISFRLRPEEFADLEYFAKKTGLNKTDILRKALKNLIGD